MEEVELCLIALYVIYAAGLISIILFIFTETNISKNKVDELKGDLLV